MSETGWKYFVIYVLENNNLQPKHTTDKNNQYFARRAIVALMDVWSSINPGFFVNWSWGRGQLYRKLPNMWKDYGVVAWKCIKCRKPRKSFNSTLPVIAYSIRLFLLHLKNLKQYSGPTFTNYTGVVNWSKSVARRTHKLMNHWPWTNHLTAVCQHDELLHGCFELRCRIHTYKSYSLLMNRRRI